MLRCTRNHAVSTLSIEVVGLAQINKRNVCSGSVLQTQEPNQ